MKNWIVTEFRHHAVEMMDIHTNIQADTELEAILEGYRLMIRSIILCNDVEIPDISEILHKEEISVEVIDPDEDEPIHVVLWNYLDMDLIVRGVGLGKSSKYTCKYENRWFQLKERDDSHLALALQAYQWDFHKLPKDLIKPVLEYLDKE